MPQRFTGTAVPEDIRNKIETSLLQIDPAHRWNFSQAFSKQKSKQWHTTRKRTSQNIGCQKKKFKIVWEKFQHRVGSICSKLDSPLVRT